jgi:hypothetical protein
MKFQCNACHFLLEQVFTHTLKISRFMFCLEDEQMKWAIVQMGLKVPGPEVHVPVSPSLSDMMDGGKADADGDHPAGERCLPFYPPTLIGRFQVQNGVHWLTTVT